MADKSRESLQGPENPGSPKNPEQSKAKGRPRGERRGRRGRREPVSAPRFDAGKVEAAIEPWVGTLLECAGLENVRLEFDEKLPALRLVVRAREDGGLKGRSRAQGQRAASGRRPGSSPRPGSLVQTAEKVAAVETLLAAQLEAQGLDARTIWLSLENREAELEASDLQKAVESLAELVLKTGKACALGPMSSGERRLIHEAASSIQGVWTRSAGDGAMRRLWLLPSHQPQKQR